MDGLTQSQEKIVKSVKSGILRKFPLLGSTMSKLIFQADPTMPTAATDGKVIYFNENFVNTLPYDQKIFLFAHEIAHVAFNHILRSKDKDPYIWNLATDAVINQMLKGENLPLIEGGVDIADALNKSAEYMYEQLLKQKDKLKQEQQKNKQNGNSNQQNGGSNQQQNGGDSSQNQQKNNNMSDQQQNQEQQSGASNQNNNQQQDQQTGDANGNGEEQEDTNVGHAGHQLWEEAVKRAEEEEKKQQQEKNNNISKQQEKNEDDESKYDKLEEEFSKKNSDLKEKLGKEIREKIKEQSKNAEGSNEAGYGFTTFGDVGTAKAVVSWQRLLKKELEKEEDAWSYRRASEDNYYMATIESVERDEKQIVEILLDTSGSVSDKLLRNFLREAKNLIKDSKLFVGCFDTRFYGFTEIKSQKDIDNFKIKGRGGTSFDSALIAFSKDNKVNKIVFTDGCDEVTNNERNKKIKNLYWLVWERKDFTPCCGKVINVNANALSLLSKPKEVEKER